MQLSLRVSGYILIFITYVLFMYFYAPLGIGWLDWHAQRIFNAAEFLKINGYFLSYGFSIWDTCSDCSLEYKAWKDKIYLSVPSFSMLPHILINHFGSKELLFFLGPIVDKLAILICGIFVSELFIHSLKTYTRLPMIIVGLACFAFFIISPWAYKMFLAPWFEIYFLLFFLLGMLFFQHNKQRFGYLSFFIAGVFHFQWAAAAIIFYILVLVASYSVNKKNDAINYFPLSPSNPRKITYIILSLLLPLLVLVTARLFAQENLDGFIGSSIFYRIGISGNDIHNGGLFGALQFLGGNRITQCFQGNITDSMSGDLAVKIALFNCLLSLLGMVLISLLSIAGAYAFIKSSKKGRQIFLPLIFSLIFFITIFQQSLSVHLMGYSFIFSAIFAIGLSYIMVIANNRLGSSILGFVFSIPCILGILILLTRVNFLTGVNG